MSTMKDIARRLSERSELSRQDSELFVAALFDQLKIGLNSEEQVKVKGLGTFKVQTMRSRVSVDVNTGEKMLIESHDRISFTPDKQMAESVNHPFAHFDTVILNDGVEFDDLDATKETPKSILATIQESITNPEPPLASDVTPELTEDTKPKEEPEITSAPVQALEPVEPLIVHEIADDKTDENELAINEKQVTDENAPINNELTGATLLFSGDSGQQTEDIKEESEQITEDAEEQLEQITEDTEEQTNLIFENTDQEEKEEDIDNNIITESDMQGFNENKGLGNTILTILVCVIMLAIGFIVGRTTSDITIDDVKNYITGQKKEPIMDDATIVYAGEKEYEIYAAQDSIMADSLERVAEQKRKAKEKAEMEARMNSNDQSIAELKNLTKKPEATVKDAENKTTEKSKVVDDKKTTANSNKETKQPASTALPSNKYDNDPRIRTGAYTIVGVKQVVTAQSGQTLESISKAYLGPGMECYLEALNGTSPIKEGQKIKIPELKLKKQVKK